MEILRGVPDTLRHWFSEGVFRRMFKNAGLLLSGRAVTGLLSLGTLTLCARTLGVEQFGVLVLVQTYAQVIATVATFQCPKAIIRYGAIALQRGDSKAFQTLLKYLTLLDGAGGMLAATVGYFAAPLVGPAMGWSAEIVGYAQFYSFLVFFNACATPGGILRLLDRFDLLAVQVTITPLLRVLGVAVAAAVKAPLWGYLLACFAAQTAGGVALTFLAWRELYRRKRLEGFDVSVKDLGAAHPGLLHFVALSNLYTSLLTLTDQASTFMVGYLAGPAAAGLYKIGDSCATVLTKPADLLKQSVYPEFARIGSRGAWHEFTRLIQRGATVAAGVGAVFATVIFAGGSVFLTTFFGEAFAGAYVPLMLMVAGAGLAMIGFPMDAALSAMGRPGIPLRVGAGVICVVQLPLLMLLKPRFGPSGAAFAILAGALATLVVMTSFTLSQLRQRTGQQLLLSSDSALANA